ncbi:MAG: NUDIX domain-containing protein [Propionibacteriaceae bacterium]|nr:NUDIX domain-containing protein [Propionibacteriaceae bacterium]
MAHIHTEPGQYDLTVSAYIVRTDAPEPNILLHRHKTLGVWIQPGGHVELDETPWQAVAHEVREETGYAMDQLAVLQPTVRLTDLAGTDLHPQPVCVRSFPFGVGTNHFHTDLAFAFVTSQPPRFAVGEGESADVIWVTRAELAGLPREQTYEDVRQLGLFILDEILGAWEPYTIP